MTKTVLSRVGVLMLCLATSVFAVGTAWSQPGTLLHYVKISEGFGGFTGLLDLSDEFGGAIEGIGDLDGPGPSVAALAVGCYLDDDGSFDRGSVYILFLKADGTVLSHQKISSTSGGFTGPLRGFDEFGSSIAWLGDLDGPGPTAGAIAVGAPFDDDGGTNEDRGCVYILFLNSNGTVASQKIISAASGLPLGTLDPVDEFGGAVHFLGDLDGPGPSAATLVVGASGDDDGGPTDPVTGRGAAYVIFLNSDGTVQSFQKISSTSGGFTGTLDLDDEFAVDLDDLGDLDGPGPSAVALVVGAAGDDDGGENRGAFYILYLNTAGIVIAQQKVSDTEGNFTPLLENEDDFGSSLAKLGDLDGSGPSTVALSVGAARDDDGGITGANRGALYVVFLDGAGSILSSTLISDSLPLFFHGNLANGDQFGAAMGTLGDIDGEGGFGQTIVAGAPFDDDGGGNSGGLYILFVEHGPTTGVEDGPHVAANGLGFARPNPFKPRTLIPFRISEAARVRIDVCDLQGRLVRRLVDEPFEPGSHEATWDGSSDSGQRMPAGAYFYRMSVNGRVETPARKTVLLR